MVGCGEKQEVKKAAAARRCPCAADAPGAGHGAGRSGRRHAAVQYGAGACPPLLGSFPGAARCVHGQGLFSWRMGAWGCAGMGPLSLLGRLLVAAAVVAIPPRQLLQPLLQRLALQASAALVAVQQAALQQGKVQFLEGLVMPRHIPPGDAPPLRPRRLQQAGTGGAQASGTSRPGRPRAARTSPDLRPPKCQEFAS